MLRAFVIIFWVGPNFPNVRYFLNIAVFFLKIPITPEFLKCQVVLNMEAFLCNFRLPLNFSNVLFFLEYHVFPELLGTPEFSRCAVFLDSIIFQFQGTPRISHMSRFFSEKYVFLGLLGTPNVFKSLVFPGEPEKSESLCAPDFPKCPDFFEYHVLLGLLCTPRNAEISC